jgi:hypothetical protein
MGTSDKRAGQQTSAGKIRRAAMDMTPNTLLVGGQVTDEQVSRFMSKVVGGLDSCACGFMQSDGRHLPYAQCPNRALGCDPETHHKFRPANADDKARHNRGSWGLPEDGAR